jgi:hypothetical protein
VLHCIAWGANAAADGLLHLCVDAAAAASTADLDTADTAGVGDVDVDDDVSKADASIGSGGGGVGAATRCLDALLRNGAPLDANANSNSNANTNANADADADDASGGGGGASSSTGGTLAHRLAGLSSPACCHLALLRGLATVCWASALVTFICVAP